MRRSGVGLTWFLWLFLHSKALVTWSFSGVWFKFPVIRSVFRTLVVSYWYNFRLQCRAEGAFSSCIVLFIPTMAWCHLWPVIQLYIRTLFIQSTIQRSVTQRFLHLLTALYPGIDSHCYHSPSIIPFQFAMRCHLYSVWSTLRTPARWQHTTFYVLNACKKWLHKL